MIEKCEVCGKEFKTQPSRVKKGYGRFCSIKCFAIFQTGKQKISHVSPMSPIIKICNFCGNEYKTKSHTRKFCSHDCYAKHLSANIKGKDHPLWKEKIKKLCAFCGKEYLVYPKDSNSKFCSIKCHNISMNNKKRKEKIKCICLSCGKEFFVLPCIIKKGWGKYCSTVCSQNGNPDEHHPNWNGGLKEAKKRYNIKMRQNPKYVTNRRMSSGIQKSLKNGKGNKSWKTFVNYSIDDLFNRLNKTMPKGYSWQDYLDGKLHVDHIIPIEKHNFKSYKDIDFQKCWALSNLQLLPASENMSKGCRIKKAFQPSFAF